MRTVLGALAGRYWRVLSAALISACVFGILIGWRTDLSTGPHTGIRTGAWDALTTGLIVIFAHAVANVPSAPRTTQAVDMGFSRKRSLQAFFGAVLLGLLFGALWGITAVVKHQHPHGPAIEPALVTGIVTGLFFVLGCWLFSGARGWLASPQPPNPLTVARHDLVTTILCAPILAVTFAFAFGVNAPFQFTGVDVVAWLIVGLALASLGSEWPLYLITIVCMSVLRRAPLHLMRFLDCCRLCGVMRVIGQEYQIYDDRLLKIMVDESQKLAQPKNQPSRFWHRGPLPVPALSGTSGPETQ